MPAPSIQCWLALPDGQRVDLVGTLTIGRLPDNELVLTDERISRRHALIETREEMQFWLVDLGGANGSYINGRRIAEPAQLQHGDVVQLSGVSLVFHCEPFIQRSPDGMPV